MKKAVSMLLLAIFVFSTSVPTFAQKSRVQKVAPVKAAAVEFDRAEAFTEGQGVYVRWLMKAEKDNVGFYVYRVGKDGLEIINQSLIPGSAIRAGGDLTAGSPYGFYDADGTLGSTYVVEALTLDGRRISTNQFGAKFTDDLKAATGKSKDALAARDEAKNSSIQKNSLILPPDLADAVNSTQQVPNPGVHSMVVGQPGAKIAVRKDGFYRVSRAELQTAGFNLAGDSANWRLFMEGVEQSIIVGAGDQYIEFFGKGIDTPESDTRIYYLIADTVAGKRIQTKFVHPIGGNVSTVNYRTQTDKKLRTTYVNKILNGDAENYWGPIVGSSTVAVTFNLNGIDFNGGKASLTLNMQGYTTVPHALSVTLNGQALLPISGDSQNAFSKQYGVSSTVLLEGTNTLQLTSLNSGDFSLFDSLSVKYARKFQADQNKVAFYTPGYRKVDLTGFTTANVRVFDTTFEGDPQLLSNVSVVQDGATFTAKIPADRPGVFYGVGDSAIMTSPAVTKNNPSALRTPTQQTPGNAADMVIISYSSPDFMAAAEAWAAYRRTAVGGNFNVKVVDVADIYDEFNYGVMSAESIRSFLGYTKTSWTTAPRYVLLLGDASYDPRNYEGFGYLDMVPTKIVTLIYGESSSDEAMADFDNDGSAEMAVGRISARQSSQVTTAYNKTVRFETPPMQAFSRGVVFAYDLPIGYDFLAMSQILRNELPADAVMPATYIDRGSPTAHDDLINRINAGPYLVNYCGHGASGLWGSSNFFVNTDVPSLVNNNSPSVFVMLTCLNGYFIRPDADAMAELLVNSPIGGGVAAWASTTETTPDIQLVMGTRYFNQLNAGQIPRLGDLIRDAKSTIAGSEVSFSWGLFGDPALRMRPDPQ